jgi:hypothetical protein
MPYFIGAKPRFGGVSRKSYFTRYAQLKRRIVEKLIRN